MPACRPQVLSVVLSNWPVGRTFLFLFDDAGLARLFVNRIVRHLDAAIYIDESAVYVVGGEEGLGREEILRLARGSSATHAAITLS